MYCRNCGNEIAEGSRFCSSCGSPVEIAPKPEITKPNVYAGAMTGIEEEPVIPRKPIFEEFQWNVSEYPDRNIVEKTEDINFNWNADPASIIETPRREAPAQTYTGQELEKEIFQQAKPKLDPQEMSAAERIDKFYTFNTKNEEFQKLINNEYQRVKSGNAIQHEISQAEKLAAERFETRVEDSSMDAFLEREGINKPYQPKEFQSDVLQRIELQEAEREAQRLEEEARLAAIEEARLAAEAQKKAEEEAQRLEEIAKRKAEEEARAAEEARLRAQEEARLKAEEEARLRAEAEARQRAEAEARVRAAEEARLRAEADLRAAQEAAKIRAQQEARLAAEAEAQFKAEQERKRMEADEAQRQLEEKRRLLAQEADNAMAYEEARKVLEHTARLREQEEAKIRAAVASLRGGAADPFAGRENNDIEDAHQATRDRINEMAKARDAFFADMDFEDDAEPNPVTGRDTMLSSDEISRTRVIKKADITAGLNEATRVADVKPVAAPLDDEDFFNSLETLDVEETEAQPIDFKEQTQPADDLEDLLSQFEETINEELPEEVEPAIEIEEEKPGLEDTVLMPQHSEVAAAPANDFDNYGNDVIEQQPQKHPEEDFYEDGFYGDDENLSKKERKKKEKEQKRLEKERAKEEKAAAKGKKAKNDYIEESEDDGEEGGKGRVVLKVILAILIVILVVEVAGMGIRFLAPQSKAAEFIDNQLNKVIQLITGDDTEYSVIAAQVRTEPIEDKTDFINSQISKNKNGVIENVAYSADLAYDQETDGEISDLVLSTPMAVVEWGRDEKNYPVYFDEQVVGQIIAFESAKAEYMNNGDEAVLDMMDPNMELYKDIKKLKGKKMSGPFKKLEIGEIRQAGSNYYVWVRETVGDTTTEKVYSMYPEKQFVMKMAACYII